MVLPEAKIQENKCNQFKKIEAACILIPCLINLRKDIDFIFFINATHINKNYKEHWGKAGGYLFKYFETITLGSRGFIGILFYYKQCNDFIAFTIKTF